MIVLTRWAAAERSSYLGDALKSSQSMFLMVKSAPGTLFDDISGLSIFQDFTKEKCHALCLLVNLPAQSLSSWWCASTEMSRLT